MLGEEEIEIPLGAVRALHLRHVDEKDPSEVVDVWLGIDQQLPAGEAALPGGAQPPHGRAGRHARPSRADAMSLGRAQLDAIIHALTVILPGARAGRTQLLRQFFRDNKNLGQSDRALIADTVYAALRRRRLLEHVTPEGHAARDRARRAREGAGRGPRARSSPR